ncbi:hypothetical protein NLJ89_g1879 [Agrocybe chaxingu]|uniref:Hemerythrin-like domain-containing protein n=1 Tax=Agrocybe chaxingu TaxID=84603 RepID=A0A9W8TDL4_9AGAR|nr:hypothetical protein NLJ89_g1879 [Agrocybe chaxingu]
MSGFHEWFKQEFNTLYTLADGSFTSRGLSLAHYLETAKTMNRHLKMHHTIEERYVFPILGKKMPQFAKENEDVTQSPPSYNAPILGLVKLEKLVDKWIDEPSTYSPKEMRDCLDSFRDVLFHHLDEEVEDIRGENLKKYFTLQEVAGLPI